MDSYKEPIIITPKIGAMDKTAELLQGLKKLDWFSIIMPIKPDDKTLRNDTQKNVFV